MYILVLLQEVIAVLLNPLHEKGDDNDLRSHRRTVFLCCAGDSSVPDLIGTKSLLSIPHTTQSEERTELNAKRGIISD